MKKINNYLIAAKEDLENREQEIIEAIKNGETVCTWSVQDDCGADDIFNGSYAECKAYIEEANKDGADYVGIARIELDEKLCSVYTHEFVEFSDL